MDPWEAVFRKSGKVAWRQVDEDGVLLNLGTGYYYTVNEVGGFSGNPLTAAGSSRKFTVRSWNGMMWTARFPGRISWRSSRTC